MKKIFSLIIVLSTLTLGQSELVTLFSNGIVYNGTELITNEIDRTLEPASVYVSNFSAGADGWANIWGTIAGNIDGVWGRDNVAKITANASGIYNYRSWTIAATSRYAFSLYVYSPSANSIISIDMMLGTLDVIATRSITENSWQQIKVSGLNPTLSTQIRILANGAANGDSLYIDNVLVSNIASYKTTGNHSTSDTSSTYKKAGSYSQQIIATGAGNGTTNTISLASAKFSAVTSGTNYRFQVYAYTTTASTTLTFKLGDIVQTAVVSTVGMSVINFDFKATASSTGDILLYLDKAATVYIDEVSLKSGS